MVQYVVVDSEGEEHTDPIDDREEAHRALEQAHREGTLDYSLKTIGRGFM